MNRKIIFGAVAAVLALITVTGCASSGTADPQRQASPVAAATETSPSPTISGALPCGNPKPIKDQVGIVPDQATLDRWQQVVSAECPTRQGEFAIGAQAWRKDHPMTTNTPAPRTTAAAPASTGSAITPAALNRQRLVDAGQLVFQYRVAYAVALNSGAPAGIPLHAQMTGLISDAESEMNDAILQNSVLGSPNVDIELAYMKADDLSMVSSVHGVTDAELTAMRTGIQQEWTNVVGIPLMDK